MSFNPRAKQATTANTKNAVAVTDDSENSDGEDHIFKLRTFDVFWVDKSALMYRDGFAKVRFIIDIFTLVQFMLSNVVSIF